MAWPPPAALSATRAGRSPSTIASSRPCSFDLRLDGEHVVERARHFERLDERVEVFGTARLHADPDDEHALLEPRLHGRDADVVGQRGLELREELCPGECALVDEVVGLACRGGDGLQLGRVDLRADARRLRRAAAPPPVRRRPPCAPSVCWLVEQRHDPDDVEQRDREDQGGERHQRDLHGADVVERAGGEVGADHQAATASRRVRSSMPTSGASTSINSGVIAMRSRQRRHARRVDRFHADAETLLEAASRGVQGQRHASGTAEQHATEALSRQPVLVVHRRLMHEVRQGVVLTLRPAADRR